VPTWLLIVLIVLLVLAVGGVVARSRQLARTRGAFEDDLARANEDLATAAAQDRGWDRETLEAAARRVYAEQRGSEPDELLLVEVRDRPGTDEDEAVFQVRAGHAGGRLTLGREAGEWVFGTLA
jgi:uncharacterized Ntn-hydrolase superfamily protein